MPTSKDISKILVVTNNVTTDGLVEKSTSEIVSLFYRWIVNVGLIYIIS